MLSFEEIFESQRLTLQIAELGGEVHDEIPYIPRTKREYNERRNGERKYSNYKVNIKFKKRKLVI